VINPLNAQLNPICHLLALLGFHHILHVSGIRVKTPITATCFYSYKVAFRLQKIIYIYIYNRVLSRVFGPKRDEVTWEWRKLHNEELRDLYALPNIVLVVKSRRMRWAGHVARMGEGRGVHRFLVEKPEGKRPLGRPRRR